MKLLISFNVFSLYFVKNTWFGKDHVASESYKYATSLCFIYLPGFIFLMILLQNKTGNYDEMKAPLIFVGIVPIFIGALLSREIEAAAANFGNFKYRHYYFLYLIYITLGIAGLLWLTYQGIGR